jgi:hypothetical protein
MMPSAANVRFEQAVYGSFPFWNRGYAVLARSAGCRPGWLAALRTACQRYGERPAGVADADALFVKRIDRGPWMIVGVSPQGDDDAGRPGALAFHALFVGPWTYARAGADPFAFAGILRRDWSPEDLDATLPPGRAIIRRAAYRTSSEPAASVVDERREAIVEALARGRHIAVQSAGPIDALARDVWRALPFRVRLRASVATWAFDNANRFDLVALPKLAGIAREPSDLILASPQDGTHERRPHSDRGFGIPDSEFQME